MNELLDKKCKGCEKEFKTNQKRRVNCDDCVNNKKDNSSVSSVSLNSELTQNVNQPSDEENVKNEIIKRFFPETNQIFSEQPEVKDLKTEVKSNYVENNLTKELIDFKIKKEIISNKDKSVDFHHPFSSKLIGCRGAGKTTWIINYLNTLKINNKFQDRIFFFTNSSNQKLFELLELKINIKTPEELFIECFENPTLFIFDDCMQDLKNNKTLEKIYSRGRHLNISLFSLEQSLQYSNNVERQNTDYFLIFKQNDLKGLEYFREKFCVEISSVNLFNNLILYCKKRNLPLIISFNEINFKFRSNFNEKIILEENDFWIEKIIKPQIKIIKPIEIPKKKNKLGKNILKYSLITLLSPLYLPYIFLKDI